MNTNSTKTYISEIISDQYHTWVNGDIIILKSGTATGKTTFCKNHLLPFAANQNEKLLYICNRLALEESVQSEIDKYLEEYPEHMPFIKILKYQDIEAKFKTSIEKTKTELAQYKYIFLDECHYFTSDAPINPYTELTFKYFKNNKTSILIYASATAPQFFAHLQKERNIPAEHTYEIPTDYSFVNNVYIYKQDQLMTILENIISTESDSKTVIFCMTGDRIMEIYRTFGERLVDVYCSKNYKDKRVTEIKNNRAIENKTFKKRILLSTSVIDNGIDLKDMNIKHIFTEMPTIDSIIQTLGRKRPLENCEDTCNFYIREYTEAEIKKLEHNIDTQLEMVNLWKSNNTKFRNKFGTDRSVLRKSNILYFNVSAEKLSINQIAYTKYKIDKMQYSEMLKTNFLDVLINNIQPDLANKITKIDINDYKDKFLEYLKTLESKKLFKTKWEQAQKIIGQEFARLGKPNRWLGLNTINAFLDERYGNKYRKRFISKRENSRTSENRNKTYKILE